MRWPWSRDPLWEVRLKFAHVSLEIDGKPVGGGATTRFVRAADPVAARRLALAEAKAALAALEPSPPDAQPLWSIDGLAKVRRRGPETLHLFAVPSFVRPLALAELALELAEADLALQFGPQDVAVIGEFENSFTVRLEYEELHYAVYARDWHGHFADVDQAVACFQWLLTPFYRVVSEERDGELSAAWLERYEGEAWETFHPVLFRNPTDPTRWLPGRWTREYLQQAVRTLPVPYEEIVPGAALDEDGFPVGTTLGATNRTFDRSLAEEAGWLEENFEFNPGEFEPPKGIDP